MGEASNMLCLLDRPNHLALEHPTTRTVKQSSCDAVGCLPKKGKELT